jgi:hypothetical protein
MQHLHNGEVRSDQETVDYLVREKFDYFDMNEAHIRDFKNYNISWEDYKKQYFIGHYSPRGQPFLRILDQRHDGRLAQPEAHHLQQTRRSLTGFQGLLTGLPLTLYGRETNRMELSSSTE